MDPLGDLCLAAAEDAEQENREVNDLRTIYNKPVEIDTRERSHTPEKKTSTELLVDLYKDQCNNEGVDPFEDHINMLTDIPHQLIVHTRECQIRRRVTGGAVIRVSGGSSLQLAALLTTLAPPKDATILPVVDTLNLSGMEISEEVLMKMVGNALLWGPWWRLRCLILRDCGLELGHIEVLASADSVPCFWNLEYLDISHNSGIGRTRTGVTRGPEDFAGTDVAFLIHFWKQTRLRWLSLEHCHLGAEALRCILTILRRYEIPSNSLECGFAIHNGSRPALESLILGDDDVAIMEEDMQALLSEELALLVRELPNISFLKVHGISERHVSNIVHSWEAVHDNQRRVDVGDDNSLQLANTGEPVVGLPPEHILPDSSFDVNVEDPEERASPQLPKQILDDFGLNKAIQKPAAANDAEPVTLVATNQLDKYSLNIISPSRVPKRSHPKDVRKRSAKTGGKQNQLYRGGDRNDTLPLVEIDIHSDSEDKSSNDERREERESDGESSASDSSGSHDSARGTPANQSPAHKIHQDKFRLRDGMLDEDSRLGRVYRSDARRNILRIPNNTDQKAAKRAFKLWDQCTENSWDRRRWDNPSKTQNDEPHILGQLNLLFDILDRYKLGIGFPFPLWKKGHGEHAFEVQATPRNVVEKPRSNPRPERRETPQPIYVEKIDIREKGNVDGGRLAKSRAFVLSSDEEEDVQVPNKRTVQEEHLDEETEQESNHKKLRELNRLSAWAWDSRVESHPPNKEMYGPTTGKRQRKQLHGDVASLLDSQIDELDPFIDEKEEKEWSTDDDVPLFRSKDLDTAEECIIPDSQDSDDVPTQL